jgi:hypothetical protein
MPSDKRSLQLCERLRREAIGRAPAVGDGRARPRGDLRLAEVVPGLDIPAFTSAPSSAPVMYGSVPSV